jgi:hypothetical protein
MADKQATPYTETATGTPEKIPTRADIRSRVFAAKKPASEIIDFFGAKIELRQPLLRDIVEAQQSEDREAAVIETLVKHAYVPNTKVFEEADADAFKAMPFGHDFITVSEALTRLTEVNFLDRSKSSGQAPGNSP